jgi:Putative adhesin
MRKAFFRILAIASALFILTSAATAQDFQKTYQLGPDGQISVRNVSGDVIVTGYSDGQQITVNAIREGRDRDLVQVEDLSSANRIELRARYPKNCNCDASIRFEVQVPRSVRYQFQELSSASGNIEVSDVTGEARINTASGDVMVKDVTGRVDASTASGQMRVRGIAGTISARSASGDVDVEVSRLDGNQRMEFSSASGDVNVRLPGHVDAEVELSSATGEVKTNFPLSVESERYGPGQRARGRLGNGSRRLQISSASGNVSLTSL